MSMREPFSCQLVRVLNVFCLSIIFEWVSLGLTKEMKLILLKSSSFENTVEFLKAWNLEELDGRWKFRYDQIA